MSPFTFDRRACVSFSGGRTSGLMLARIVKAHGGALPPDVVPVFANTGDEHEGTLEFVAACASRWSVPIRWIEYQPEKPGWREVTFDTASRRGEPFDALISKRKYLPNPVTRFCTAEMKAKPIAAFMRSTGEEDWTTVIGMRADEPRRVAKMRARAAAGEDIALPLADAGVSRADVLAFWSSQPFDLQIPAGAGNCVGCFMKGVSQLVNVFSDTPRAVDRWIARERLIGATVRKDRPPYAALARVARHQLPMFDATAADLPCLCED